jgi:hypothetical protein
MGDIITGQYNQVTAQPPPQTDPQPTMFPPVL